jgi:sugar phosphate isomerase/epimerase
VKRGSAHLTYCTNIHPGETWPEVRTNLERHVTAVKARVAPGVAFGVGLRLSAIAARELATDTALAELRALLAAHDLYVFTINGFPYGEFHGRPVKAAVYRPDWLEDERLAYTNLLADLLADLLPPGVDGTISTVPGCFRERADAGAAVRIAAQITAHAAHLEALERRTGKRIVLALEPEPCCLLETVEETIAFFTAHLGPETRRHVGICLDACHAAVEFEHLPSAIAALRAAGITIAKVQLSAGLLVSPVGAAERRQLVAFEDTVSLHQVVARRGEALARHVDLDVALAAPDGDDEWRIHFHVPIFSVGLGAIRSTQPFLAELLALHRRDPITAQLEVETYTWDVLPADLRSGPVTEAIARELAWVIAQLEPRSGEAVA